jgi:hypothetical protein
MEGQYLATDHSNRIVCVLLQVIGNDLVQLQRILAPTPK